MTKDIDYSLPANMLYEQRQNQFQHLAENDNLTSNQKTIIRMLLTGPYFVQFSYESQWDFIYSKSKIEIVSVLLDNQWTFQIGAAYLEDDVYMLEISFNNPISIFSGNRYKDDEREKAYSFEIYLAYSSFLELYHAGFRKDDRSFWNDLLKKD